MLTQLQTTLLETTMKVHEQFFREFIRSKLKNKQSEIDYHRGWVAACRYFLGLSKNGKF